jgi:hypothetical protein
MKKETPSRKGTGWCWRKAPDALQRMAGDAKLANCTLGRSARSAQAD